MCIYACFILCCRVYMIVLLFVMSCCVLLLFCFFFFKQKTAYEMRISDWSSDVCSSDLVRAGVTPPAHAPLLLQRRFVLRPTAPRAGSPAARRTARAGSAAASRPPASSPAAAPARRQPGPEIGRAACRERVCQCVDLGGRRILKKKQHTKHNKITTQ